MFAFVVLDLVFST